MLFFVNVQSILEIIYLTYFSLIINSNIVKLKLPHSGQSTICCLLVTVIMLESCLCVNYQLLLLCRISSSLLRDFMWHWVSVPLTQNGFCLVWPAQYVGIKALLNWANDVECLTPFGNVEVTRNQSFGGGRGMFGTLELWSTCWAKSNNPKESSHLCPRIR